MVEETTVRDLPQDIEVERNQEQIVRGWRMKMQGAEARSWACCSEFLPHHSNRNKNWRMQGTPLADLNLVNRIFRPDTLIQCVTGEPSPFLAF